MKLSVRQLACFSAVSVLTLNSAQADWPSFLGGTQRYEQSAKIPAKWSESEGLTWKSALPGHGQSSPIVVGNNIYLTAIEGPNKEKNLALCFDLETGKQKWSKELSSSLLAKNDPYTSRAAPTPVADASGAYFFFESGDFIACAPNGDTLWERNLLKDYGKYEGRFGLGGSLCQDDDHVFVLADNDGPAYILALNKKTGETAWKQNRESRTAWSSPMMLNVGENMQIVVSSAGTIDGYDPATGNLLWTIDDVGGNTVASPVPFGDSSFLVGASPGRNGENSAGARKSNMAVQVVAEGDGYSAKVLWRNEEVTSSFGSPMYYEGKAYYANRSGGLYCLNAQTGETVYKKRIEESNWATPYGINGNIYLFGQKGATTVIKAGDEFEELAVNRLWQPPADGGGPGGFNAEIQYGIAVVDAGLLIRTGSNLYFIGSEG